MSLTYTYEITHVSGDGKHLEVLYSSSGQRDILVGQPAPMLDQDPIAVIRSYAPIAVWERDNAVYQTVKVGDKGTLEHGAPVPTPPPAVPQAVTPVDEVEALRLVESILGRNKTP